MCHCDFCQRRSGNVFIASASFHEDQVISITGETGCYNGLEIDDAARWDPGGINYRFCAVRLQRLLRHDLPAAGRFFTIALGAFVDAVFPTPTVEYYTKFRHPWVPAIPGAVQLEDPLGADAEQAWRETDAGRRTDT